MRFCSIYESFITGTKDITTLTPAQLLDELTTFKLNNGGAKNSRFKSIMEKYRGQLQVSPGSGADGKQDGSDDTYGWVGKRDLNNDGMQALLSQFSDSCCLFHCDKDQHKHSWWECPIFMGMDFHIMNSSDYMEQLRLQQNSRGRGSGGHGGGCGGGHGGGRSGAHGNASCDEGGNQGSMQ